MTPLTVICWFWKGWRDMYGPEHVNTLRTMLEAHLRIPHRLVCVTDQPTRDIKCETFPLWDWPNVRTEPRAPNCYRRLKLFSPNAAGAFGERMLSIDLDCVLFDDITPLITHHDFRIVQGYTAPYNGSMWLLRAGTRPQVYTDFDPAASPAEAAARKNANGTPFLGSDQAWIGHKLPGEAVWTRADGVQLFHELRLPKFSYNGVLPSGPAGNPRIMFFPGLMKPWHPAMKRDFPHIYAEYMLYHRGH